MALFVEEMLNQPCSPARVLKRQNQATAALRPADDELTATLPSEPVLGINEFLTYDASERALRPVIHEPASRKPRRLKALERLP